MIDVLATLCLLEAPETCAERAVPVGAATCAEARSAAEPRLEAWSREARVQGVRCGPMAVPPLPFEEVAPGLWVHRGAVAIADAANGGAIGNVAFVVGADAVLVVDAGGSRSQGEAVVAAVRAVTDLPIRVLLLTHPHPDHVLGATALADAGAAVRGHARLAADLEARAVPYLEQARRQVGPAILGTAMPEAVRPLAPEGEALDLGGRVVDLASWPAAHSHADATAFDRATATLVAGDLVMEGHVPTLDGSLRGWLGVLDALDGLGAARVVPGHGGPALEAAGATAPVRGYLGALADDVRAAIARGDPIGEAAERAAAGERGAWALFDEHNPRNAIAAYAELEWE